MEYLRRNLKVSIYRQRNIIYTRIILSISELIFYIWLLISFIYGKCIALYNVIVKRSEEYQARLDIPIGAFKK
jgi:hypothetical protein